jgi:TP901 family phage tail tape measure protein
LAEQYDLDAVIRFTTEGFANAQRQLDELHRQGKINDEQHKNLASSLTKAGQAADRQLAKGVGAATTATRDFNKETANSESNLIRQRYALYDVATTYGAVSAAALAAVGATATLAAKYESAFSAVERTTLSASGAVSGSIDKIKQDLYSLSTEIPLAFDELSNIASLGAQLGIPEQGLASFTETVAKFAATTNISIDQAALAFGQLDALFDDIDYTNFENLGAAIALVGVNSAATESQIVAVARELAPSAAAAGFAAQEVIGLSGALASLKVPPERSRSTLLQFFETLNMAVSEGGDKLANFATVVGVSSDQLEQMVRTGQGKSILERFIGNVSSADTVEVTQALDALGLAGLRVNPTIRALAGNTELLSQTFADAKRGFEEGTFLDAAFAKVLEDAASQLQLLANAFANFMSVAGVPFLELLKAVVPPAVQFLNFLTDLANTPVGQFVFGIVGGLTLLVGLITGYRATAALATASSYAMATAFGTATTTTLTLRGAVTGLVGTLLGVPGAATGAASGVQVLRGALLALGRATLIFGAFQLGAELIFNFGESMMWLVNGPFQMVADGLSGLIGMFAGFYEMLSGLPGAIGEAYGNVGTTLRNVQTAVAKTPGIIKPFIRSLMDAADEAGKIPKIPVEEPVLGWGGAFDSFGDSVGGAAKQVRTLVDYANDLAGVFGRSFDIRFKSMLSMDAVAESWQNLTDRVDEARIKLAELTANKAIKEYFLGVAQNYGDTLRADKLAAELADLNKQIAETQADASTELQGNTKAARQNRKVITDLLKQYEDYIAALAEGGADQATLNAAVNASRAQFLAQAQALGFASSELQPYVAHFGDLSTAIARIPRNITVAFNGDPALQALNEFMAKAKSAVGSGINVPISSSFDPFGVKKSIQGEIDALNAALMAEYARLGGNSNARTTGLQNAIRQLQQKLNNLGYAQGGFTGRGGKYEPAGIVHRGEYVIPKEHVNQRTGLPYASALGQLQAGTRASSSGGYASGGYVGGNGRMVVDLSAQARAAMNRPVVVTLNGKVIAEATYNNTYNQSLRGSD